MALTVDRIIEIGESAQVRLVRFVYCDVSSMIRGKTARMSSVRERAVSGIGLVKGQLAMNMLDQFQADTGLSAVGEVRLVPDPSTFVLLPYSPGQAAMICDLVELDRRPWALCPRSLLKRVLADAENDGALIRAAFEPEFTLGTVDAGEFVPIDRSLCFSTEGMNRAAPFIIDLVDALERQGIQVEQYYPELGHGQHEVSISHAQALSAADRHILYRETLRGVAQQHGLAASLAPKPFTDQPGNGCHLHVSVWNAAGDNLLYGDAGLSDFGKMFVAGVLDHLPALVALTCSSVNSYRRLKPSSWSSAYTCWGYENREAAVRVPSTYWGQERASTNLELKCVDSSSNPYLALAGLIACGMDGVRRQLLPPDPVHCDPHTLPDRESKKVRRLPQSLKEAMAELEKDSLLTEMLGVDLCRTFQTVKQSECAAFAAEDCAFELFNHRTKY